MSSTPTVYFIDDSATMREVIKIAFRRENLNVVACHDGPSALAQMEEQRPDVVITDVIMPGKDGYEVCQHIREHPALGKIPVILMSGVVNKSVAEKAFAVKADELIRKPFQPQDLITRVRHLLQPKTTTPAPAVPANAVLSSIFAARPGVPAVAPRPTTTVVAPVAPTPSAAAVAPAPFTPQPRPAALPTDAAKLRVEVLRLEGLVKKLQAELEAERDYARALEEHLKTLQEAE